MTADAPARGGIDRHQGITSADLDGLTAPDRDLALYLAMAYLRCSRNGSRPCTSRAMCAARLTWRSATRPIAVGVGSALGPDDRSIGTYRGHAHALVRGADPEAVMLELLGRDGGICAGKGGSMHIASIEHGYMGSHAIIGAHLPIAAGLGLGQPDPRRRPGHRLLLR